jgi:hypothetical protein
MWLFAHIRSVCPNPHMGHDTVNGIAKAHFASSLDRSLTFVSECAHSAVCAPYKHHYDECVERVTRQEEAGEDFKGPKEDCVEECKYNCNSNRGDTPSWIESNPRLCD